jgi:mono/diheme cytochrome c family protein
MHSRPSPRPKTRLEAWSWAAAAVLLAEGCSQHDRDLPPEYDRLEVPETRLASRAAQRRGQALFLEHGALCHGARGDGQGVRRSGLSTPPANLRDPAWRRRTSPRRMYYAIREGMHGTTMQSWRALDAGDAWDLVAHLLALGQRTT